MGGGGGIEVGDLTGRGEIEDTKGKEGPRGVEGAARKRRRTRPRQRNAQQQGWRGRGAERER
jgi:hypothetical protein